jgi:hypothetical protein
MQNDSPPTTEAYEQQLTSIWASICAALDHIEDNDIGGATLILQTVLKTHFGAIRATPWTSSRRTSGAVEAWLHLQTPVTKRPLQTAAFGQNHD